MEKIKITFELLDRSSESISSFSRGHIIIKIDNFFLSSKQRQPDQSMMLFPAAIQLLDGTRMLIKNKQIESFEFVGDDSSFIFFLRKQDHSMISIESMDGKKSQVPINDLVSSVWQGIQELLKKQGQYLSQEEIIYSDFHYALQKFMKEFKEQL